MSYTEHPETNPYAAPAAKVGGEFGARATFYGYAGFWRRFAAYFLDSIIMGIVGAVFGGVVGAAIVASGSQITQGVNIAIQLVSFLIGLSYFAVMESSSSQATLGKMALGVKVTDLHGRRITLGRAIGRYLGKILSGLILAIGFIMAAFTEKKQALHDMIAGTLVVKTR